MLFTVAITCYLTLTAVMTAMMIIHTYNIEDTIPVKIGVWFLFVLVWPVCIFVELMSNRRR